MPDRLYLATNDPPTMKDHFFAHPFEIVISAWSIVVGIMLLFGSFVPNFDPSQAIETLNPSFQFPLGLFFVIGGTLVQWAYWCKSLTLGSAWAMERSALLVLVGAWTTYFIFVVYFAPERYINWGNAVAFSLAFFVRWLAIGARQSTIRRTQRKLRRENDEDE